ncbi:hypothetical protein B0H13DRAFT_1915244 [Mycena leptocephala]|nr:hypothetical protein B0H13DRAFT_1915244 [Mycena leptocephala]
MSDTLKDWIWSKYTTPDPALGMQSLYQMCSTFTKHVLQPSHIVLAGGGFTLHADLAGPLIDIIPAMDHLLRSLSNITVLTTTTGLIVPATLHQIIWNWVHLIDELDLAMTRLKSFWMDYPLPDPSSSSRMSQILVALPPSLRVVKCKNCFTRGGKTQKGYFRTLRGSASNSGGEAGLI